MNTMSQWLQYNYFKSNIDKCHSVTSSRSAVTLSMSLILIELDYWMLTLTVNLVFIIKWNNSVKNQVKNYMYYLVWLDTRLTHKNTSCKVIYNLSVFILSLNLDVSSHKKYGKQNRIHERALS